MDVEQYNNMNRQNKEEKKEKKRKENDTIHISFETDKR